MGFPRLVHNYNETDATVAKKKNALAYSFRGGIFGETNQTNKIYLRLGIKAFPSLNHKVVFSSTFTPTTQLKNVPLKYILKMMPLSSLNLLLITYFPNSSPTHFRLLLGKTNDSSYMNIYK